MKPIKNPKPRAVAFSLIATACALSLLSACSHKQSDANADANPDSAAMAPDPSADPNAAPVAGTDAAPPADGQQTQASAGTTDAKPSDTDSPSKPERPARKHSSSKRTHQATLVHQDSSSAAMNAEPGAAAGTSINKPTANSALNTHAPAPTTPVAEQAPAAPARPVTAPPQTAAPTLAQNSHPENTAARNPASAAGNTANDAELGAEGGGGFLENLMAYRAALMAALGLALAGGGGFAFWKKRQTTA